MPETPQSGKVREIKPDTSDLALARRLTPHGLKNVNKKAARSRKVSPWSLLGSGISPQKSYRQQLFDAYLCTYVPFSKLGHANEEPWLCLVPGLLEPTRALEIASMALCTATLARSNNDQWMLTESHKLYTQGLSDVQRALWDSSLIYKGETLAACMALAMYELIECPSQASDGYVNHYNGCATLIHLRGSRAFSSGLAHQIFSAFRLQGVRVLSTVHLFVHSDWSLATNLINFHSQILRTLETCRPNFLTESKWLRNPWEHTPKSHTDKILDVLAMAPRIFARVNNARNLDPSNMLSSTLETMNMCRELDSSLTEIHDQVRLAFPGPLYWSEFSKETCFTEDAGPEPSNIFPVAFHFSDLRMAKTMMYYWATQHVLWSGMSQLSLLLSTLQQRPEGVANMSRAKSRYHFDDFITPAQNVCQSIEYCLEDGMLSLGTNLAIAPLIIVAITLQPYAEYEKEKKWINFKLSQLRETGPRILEHSKGVR